MSDLEFHKINDLEHEVAYRQYRTIIENHPQYTNDMKKKQIRRLADSLNRDFNDAKELISRLYTPEVERPNELE